jgi:HK97 family phage major capsid protein
MNDLSEIGGMVRQIGEKFTETKDTLEKRMGRLEAAMSRPGLGLAGGDDVGAEAKAVNLWARGKVAEAKAMSPIAISDDGKDVTVRADWSTQIFKQIRESSPVRQVANILQTSTNELEVLVDKGEPGSAWVAETGQRADTAASFLTRHNIPVFEHYAYPSITNHLLEDSSFDVAEWLQSKIGTRFGREESASFVNGDGNGKPRGLLDYDRVPDADFEWKADPADYVIGAHYAGGTSIDVDDLLDVIDKVKVDYLPRAGWMMTRAMRTAIRKLKDTNSRPVLQAATSGVQDGFSETLLGYPVFLAEDMPAIAVDAVGLLFGDFGEAYTIVDRRGVQVIRDPFTAPGFTKYYVSKRVGGALTNPEAVKALVLGAEPAGE